MPHKTLVLKISNLAIYFVTCLLVGTGVLLSWQMKYGFFRGEGTHWLGFEREAWKNLHLYLCVPMAFLTFQHIYMNMQWLKKVAAHDHTWRWLLGIAIGILIILLPFIIPATNSGGH